MRNGIVAAVFGLASVCTAQEAKFCSPDDSAVCYSVNVPTDSATSSGGDLFFQIKAPSSMQWVGLGQGGQMDGANIFMIYADSDKKNVTLSPRLGTGEVQPLHENGEDATVTLLSGSGISGGMMTANVKCTSCNSWTGGSMSYTSTSSSWIWAYKKGDAVASDSLTASLEQHDEMGSFKFDLAKATGGDSQNPFVASGAKASASASASASGSASTGGYSGSTSTSSGSSSSPSSGSGGMLSMMQEAHGIIAGVTFVYVALAKLM